jgi:histidinol-phosphate aminotransferase
VSLSPRPAVRKMAPYKPPAEDRAGKIRLDFNENTVGASPKVVAALQRAITADALTLYPEYSQARPKLAKYFGVREDQILLTNGTDEAIQVMVNAFVDDGDEVMIPEVTYAMYRFYSELAGATVTHEITSRTRAAFLSNPNNPTGSWRERDECIALLEKYPNIAFLFDEAYFEFSGITVLDLLDRYPNLFVSRTFSKVYGMATMRMGCLFSNAENMAWMRKSQSPYSVNMLAIIAASAAVDDPEYVKNYVRESNGARDYLYAQFAEMGIETFPSKGNFILFRVGDRSLAIRDALRDRGVLVRDRSYELPGCVRVTCGTREQAARFIAELRKIW